MSSEDWTGLRVRTVTLGFELPDAVAPATVERGSQERRPLAVAFEDLSFSVVPRGRPLAPPRAGR
jgi:hypothetical protein